MMTRMITNLDLIEDGA